MSLSTIVYAYELACASTQAGLMTSECCDEVVDDLTAAYGAEAFLSAARAPDMRVRAGYYDLFAREPAVTQRLLDYLLDSDYLALEFTARRYLRLPEPPRVQPKRALVCHLVPAA